MSDLRMESTRVAFLETLTELMEADPKTVVVFADSVKVSRKATRVLSMSLLLIAPPQRLVPPKRTPGAP